MKIGIIGTGMVGQTLAGRLAVEGHEVVIGTRDVEATMARTEPPRPWMQTFADWSRENPAVRLATFAEAAAHGEVLVNATAGSVSVDALREAGEERMAGKILIDVSNPLDFSAGMPPTLSVVNTDSVAEQLQRAFPHAKVVKTLNTVTAMVMVDPK
jgi:predicted dinucleotide-binding enzyme